MAWTTQGAKSSVRPDSGVVWNTKGPSLVSGHDVALKKWLLSEIVKRERADRVRMDIGGLL